MDSAHQNELDHFMVGLKKRNEGQPEFHQAVYEVAATIVPYIADKAMYKDQQILERLTEPDRVIMFRVCWEDDDGKIRTNRGYRVQHNNAIGHTRAAYASPIPLH